LSTRTTEPATAEQILVRLEQMPVSSRHLRIRLFVGIATFFDGIDALAIAYVLPVLVTVWDISPHRVGILISAGYLGQLFGALFAGWMAERIGRLPTMAYTVATYAIFSLLCALSWDYTSLLVFRTLQGLGLGGEVPVAAAYINEFARAKGRGRFVLLYEQVYSAGRLMAALLGVWVVTRFGWRYMFLFGGLPALLVVFLRRCLPESPRWLASQGRLEEADRVVTELETKAPVQVTRAMLHDQPVRARPAEKAQWKELFQGAYRSRTFTSWAVWFIAFLLLNGLATWVPTLYVTVFRLPVQTSLRYGAISSIAGFAGCVTVALLIDWSGRRLWYVGAFSLAGLACVGLWFFGAWSAVAVVVIASVTAFAANSIAMLVFLHTPEIYPTRIRALATSVASAWLRVASIAAPLFIGFTIGTYRLGAVFLVLGVMAWIGALITGLFSMETKDRVLEEISP
jgi:putative MFS transporter